MYVYSKYLATSSKDHTCMVWRAGAGAESGDCSYTCYGTALGHSDAVGSVCLAQREATYQSKQGFLVSGGVDMVLKRWSLAGITGGGSAAGLEYLLCTHSVRAHDKDINSLACAPNDSLVASGSQDRTIKLWSARDLSPVAVLTGHKRGVWRVVFSPIDRCLLSASGDKTLRLWSLQDYTCIRTLQGHGSSVLCCRFVNKGTQVMSGGADGVLKLWTVRSGECENSWDNVHSDRIWCIATPRVDQEPAEGGLGLMCVTGSTDSTIRVWRDVTAARERERLQAQEARVLTEQQLLNDLRNKKYDKVCV